MNYRIFSENSREIQNEFLMFDTIYDNYFIEKNADLKSRQNYLNNVAETHNNIFHTTYDFSKTNEHQNQAIKDVRLNEDYDSNANDRQNRQFMNSEDNESEEQRVLRLNEYERPQADRLLEDETTGRMKQKNESFDHRDSRYGSKRAGKANQIQNNKGINQRSSSQIDQESELNDFFPKDQNQFRYQPDHNVMTAQNQQSNQLHERCRLSC